jgi:hypothetical protein
MTKLRIVSDGTRFGTRIETEDGQVIEGIQAIDWKCDAGEKPVATAVIRVRRVPIEVEVEAEIIEEPAGGGE